jgi:hypothetical protein
MEANQMQKTDTKKLPVGSMTYIQRVIQERDNILIPKSTISYRLSKGWQDYNNILEEFIYLKQQEENKKRLEVERFKHLAGVQ